MMIKLNHFSRLITILTIASAASMSIAGQAEAVVLNFEDLGNGERVQDFYNGGTGGSGTSGTSNFGASFTGSNGSGATAQVLGGSGSNFTNPPSPSTVMFMVGNSNDILNVANGFITNLSFKYANASSQDSIISIYSDLNGFGLLASAKLPNVNSSTPTLANFDGFNLAFSGVAKSVRFNVANSNQIAFDDINLTLAQNGSSQAPEPLTIIGTIMGGTAAFRMKKHLKSTEKV
jgi:hypothetical protein